MDLLKLIAFCGLVLSAVSANAEWPVSDAALSKCLTEIAAKKGWATPGEFTEVKCHSRKIKSLQGLEAFVELTKLSLYRNSIRDIPDQLLLALPKLEALNLANNKLSNLKIIDSLSLKKLYVFKSSLVYLTVENCPALNLIKANNNMINRFEVTGAPAMSKLFLHNNKLEVLDMKSLPALRYLDARHNPMPDAFYDQLDAIKGLTALHDGNTEDWD